MPVAEKQRPGEKQQVGLIFIKTLWNWFIFEHILTNY